MSLSPAPETPLVHPRAIIALHWLSAAVLVAVFGLVLVRELLEEGPSAQLLSLHRAMGLLVPVLTVARLVMRQRLGLAEVDAHSPAWQRLAAKGVQLGLYALMLALPVLGWMLTNARGHSVSAWGLVNLPTLLATDLDRADDLEDWHAWAAWSLCGLAALHAAAALWHHRVLRDGVLVAMWPSRAPKP